MFKHFIKEISITKKHVFNVKQLNVEYTCTIPVIIIDHFELGTCIVIKMLRLFMCTGMCTWNEILTSTRKMKNVIYITCSM